MLSLAFEWPLSGFYPKIVKLYHDQHVFFCNILLILQFAKRVAWGLKKRNRLSTGQPIE